MYTQEMGKYLLRMKAEWMNGSVMPDMKQRENSKFLPMQEGPGAATLTTK